MNKDKFDTYTFSEGSTGIGQMVEFSCCPEDVGKVKEFLKTIRTIDIPTTKRVNVVHGCYGRYTRFDIVQHKYAGGGNGSGGGYIEVLEIKNPPDGRCGIVIYEYSTHDNSVFYEFSNLPDAVLAFEKNRGGSGFSKCEGFLRRVVCNRFYTPWFYAVGSQLLLDDFVFPNIIEEDPTFRYGRKFVVRDYYGLPTIKTCMGSRLIRKDEYGGKTESSLLVLWEDGTVWDEYKCSERPRPLNEGSNSRTVNPTALVEGTKSGLRLKRAMCLREYLILNRLPRFRQLKKAFTVKPKLNRLPRFRQLKKAFTVKPKRQVSKL